MIRTTSLSKHRKGFSLTEIAIVLAVVGTIIGGIWAAATSVQERSRLSNAINELNIITSNMSTLMSGGYGSGSSSPCGASSPPCSILANMITAQVIPASYVNGANASNPWDINGLDMRWMGSGTYRLSYYTVSQSGCAGLIMNVTNCNPGRPGCPVTVSVAGVRSPYSAPTKSCSLINTSATCATLPLTSTEAQSLCANNNYSGGGANSVEFDYLQ